MTVEQPQTAGPAGSRRRALLILLGLVAGLAVVVMLLLLGGGDDDGTAFPTPTRTTTPTPTTTPTEDGGAGPPQTDQAFEGRDPFEPFLVEVAPPPTDGGPQPTATPTDTGTVDDDGDTTVIRLVDIFTRDGERMATVSVDGEEFTMVEGETVNQNLRAIAIGRRCATFQFGDERFELCLGQEVRK